MISGLRNWGSAGSTTSDSATLYNQPLPSWVFCRMGINTNSILEYRRLQCLPLEYTANPNHNLLSPFLESRCTPRRLWRRYVPPAYRAPRSQLLPQSVFPHGAESGEKGAEQWGSKPWDQFLRLSATVFLRTLLCKMGAGNQGIVLRIRWNKVC